MLTTESIILLVLSTGLLFTLAIQIRSTLQIKKHNLVLYRLRATHDEVFLLLVDNVNSESLSNEEKLEIRTTIEKLELLTRYFKKATERFTFKTLSKNLFLKKSSPYVKPNSAPASAEMIKVRMQVTGALLYAFTQYVPFLKIRIVMLILSLISKFLILSGLDEILSRFERFKELNKAIEVYEKVHYTYHQYQTCEI